MTGGRRGGSGDDGGGRVGRGKVGTRILGEGGVFIGGRVMERRRVCAGGGGGIGVLEWDGWRGGGAVGRGVGLWIVGGESVAEK